MEAVVVHGFADPQMLTAGAKRGLVIEDPAISWHSPPNKALMLIDATRVA